MDTPEIGPPLPPVLSLAGLHDVRPSVATH